MLKQQFALSALSLLIFLTSTNLVAGQVTRNGKCPAVTTVQRFNLNQYLGTWKEYGKYSFVFQRGIHCVTAEYGSLGSNRISVVNTQLDEDNQKSVINGTLRVVGPGKLVVNYADPEFLAADNDYWVLATDYTNYSIVYSCTDLSGTYVEFLYFFTRASSPSSAVIETGTKAILAQGLSMTEFQVTPQTNC